MPTCLGDQNACLASDLHPRHIQSTGPSFSGFHALAMQNLSRAALRLTKNYTRGYSDTQIKVRNATSNDPRDPSEVQMNEIAEMTYNQRDCVEIMEMLDKRLTDQGNNWRHVLKSLTVLYHCLLWGSEDPFRYFQRKVDIIKVLRGFQHISEDGRDNGYTIRQKAKDITELLLDESRLREERGTCRMIRGYGWSGNYNGVYGVPRGLNERPLDNSLAGILRTEGENGFRTASEDPGMDALHGSSLRYERDSSGQYRPRGPPTPLNASLTSSDLSLATMKPPTTGFGSRDLLHQYERPRTSDAYVTGLKPGAGSPVPPPLIPLLSEQFSRTEEPVLPLTSVTVDLLGIKAEVLPLKNGESAAGVLAGEDLDGAEEQGREEVPHLVSGKEGHLIQGVVLGAEPRLVNERGALPPISAHWPPRKSDATDLPSSDELDNPLPQIRPEPFIHSSLPTLNTVSEKPMEPLSANVVDLAAKLGAIFADQRKYKQLLACRHSNAQGLLDMFQRLLDVLKFSPSSNFRHDVIVAIQRLAGSSGLYPVCYELTNVTTGEFPKSSGSFADIYMGNFQGRAVCLKTIRLDMTMDMQHFLKVCSREAVLWGQLSHPNLLPFYGVFRFGSRISMVSPWMEHGDINNYLKHHPFADRILLACDVAQGLHFLHKNGVIHGDLKGANILIKESGRACVADFGISSISDPQILAWTSYSMVASKGGSARWQAPELFDPEGDEDMHNTTASDVYAWSCVAYEIFAGNVPFAHVPRDTAVMFKVTKGERPARPSADLGLTDRMWSLMRDCWEANPTERPTVDQIIERLMSNLPQDTRPADGEKGVVDLLPAQFREMAREGLTHEEMTVGTLERLLNAE